MYHHRRWVQQSGFPIYFTFISLSIVWKNPTSVREILGVGRVPQPIMHIVHVYNASPWNIDSSVHIISQSKDAFSSEKLNMKLQQSYLRAWSATINSCTSFRWYRLAPCACNKCQLCWRVYPDALLIFAVFIYGFKKTKTSISSHFTRTLRFVNLFWVIVQQSLPL